MGSYKVIKEFLYSLNLFNKKLQRLKKKELRRIGQETVQRNLNHSGKLLVDPRCTNLGSIHRIIQRHRRVYLRGLPLFHQIISFKINSYRILFIQ